MSHEQEDFESQKERAYIAWLNYHFHLYEIKEGHTTQIQTLADGISLVALLDRFIVISSTPNSISSHSQRNVCSYLYNIITIILICLF